MRITMVLALVAYGMLLVGCDGGSGATTAAAGSPGVPAPPGGGPPPAPGDAAASGTPQETPPEQPPVSDAPPPEPMPVSPAPETPQPADGANPDVNPDGTPRPPPPPRGLREQAIMAFRNGNDVMGNKLLTAYYAVSPQAKNELSQKMGWVPGLMRPSLAPRIGVAVVYLDIPINFRGSPMPIGSRALTQAVDQMQQKEAGDRKIGGTSRMSRFQRGSTGPTENFSESAKTDPLANAPAQTQVSYYLGEYGESFIGALLDKMESGEYGPILRELTQQAARPIRRPQGLDNPDGTFDPASQGNDGNPDGAPPDGGFAGPGGGGGGRGGMGGGGRGGMGGGGRGGQFGGRGGGRGGQFGGGGGGGQFAGGALAGILDDSGGKTNRRFTSRSAEKERASLGQIKQINPCIMWLGKVKEDDREEIKTRADAADIDILAVFELTLKEARSSNFINNKTTLRIYNRRTNKPLASYAPESLVNLTVEQWRQKDEKGMDPVEREINKALEALDKALSPAPLPEAVTAERAKKRIDDLVAEKPDEPLPVLIEARYYLVKGLLKEDEYREAAKELLGDDAFARLAARAKEPE